jgi:RNA polymerase sigma-19 factor, ECF subfamily
MSAVTEPQPSDGASADFEALFRAHYGPVCRFLAAIVRSREVAEELAQDVFLRMWQLRDIAGVPMTPAYLFGAAHNRARQYLRHERVVARVGALIRSPSSVSHATPADDLVHDDLAAAIDAAVAALPDRCRLVFVLSRQQHLSYTEIAQVLGISIKTVETQMWRALKTLRARLAPFLTVAVATLPLSHWLGRLS